MAIIDVIRDDLRRLFGVINDLPREQRYELLREIQDETTEMIDWLEEEEE